MPDSQSAYAGSTRIDVRLAQAVGKRAKAVENVAHDVSKIAAVTRGLSPAGEGLVEDDGSRSPVDGESGEVTELSAPPGCESIVDDRKSAPVTGGTFLVA